MPLQSQRLNRSARTMTQTTRFAIRKCLSGVALIRNYISGSKPPNFGTRMPNFQPHQHSNNFWTVRDRRKISRDSLYKIEVGESNGEVISALGRHLASKTTPVTGGQRSDFKGVNIANNVSKVRENVNVTLTRNRCQAINWWHQIYSEASPSGQNYFRSNFKGVKIANNVWNVTNRRKTSM
jgi:hypothetical protein